MSGTCGWDVFRGRGLLLAHLRISSCAGMWEKKALLVVDHWDRDMFGLVELWPLSVGLGNRPLWRSVSRALTALFLRSWACGSHGC